MRDGSTVGSNRPLVARQASTAWAIASKVSSETSTGAPAAALSRLSSLPGRKRLQRDSRCSRSGPARSVRPSASDSVAARTVTRTPVPRARNATCTQASFGPAGAARAATVGAGEGVIVDVNSFHRSHRPVAGQAPERAPAVARAARPRVRVRGPRERRRVPDSTPPRARQSTHPTTRHSRVR